MTSAHELKSLINQLSLLETLTETYQQIAANHIRKTRSSVVKNRDFITELLMLFHDVRVAYKYELLQLMKSKKIKHTDNLSLIRRNGKTTAVFIAANTGLYGNIVYKTIDMLADYLKKHQADVTIIGRMGEELFKEKIPGKKYISFEFPDTGINSEKLSDIVAHLLEYDKVLVFYAQFQSIVAQNPTISSLDSSIVLEKQGELMVKKYLFEPSLEKIIVFFETEIFGLIFEQTIRESQLAKQASRMYALDQAIQNINKSLQETTLQKNILHHRTLNAKQVNSLSGMRLWG
jgi:ATP synthase F1 gamma subunit